MCEREKAGERERELERARGTLALRMALTDEITNCVRCYSGVCSTIVVVSREEESWGLRMVLGLRLES